MPLTLQRDLDRRNVAFDHDFIFRSRSFDFRALITRYRGTVCTPAQYGTIVTAWQKSIYRFGGIPLEETIVATVLVKWDGVVHGVSLDSRSHGGLGKLCDFSQLQRCMARMLRGKPFADFMRTCPTAGEAQCLHLFEVLGAASSFFAHLQSKGLLQGSEEELTRVYPGKQRIRVENEHWVLGKEQRSELNLRHNRKLRTTVQRLPDGLDALLTMVCDGETILSETVVADNFRSVYGKLNRIMAKCSRVEKAFFDVEGRMRFTNATALVGLLLLTMSHEAMHAARAIRIAWMLPLLQASGERQGCIAFNAILSTYRKPPRAQMI